jgi:hypothetical protein
MKIVYYNLYIIKNRNYINNLLLSCYYECKSENNIKQFIRSKKNI